MPTIKTVNIALEALCRLRNRGGLFRRRPVMPSEVRSACAFEGRRQQAKGSF